MDKAALPKTISIDGVEYIPVNAVGKSSPPGNRVILVVDRGWVFAGDITREGGRIRLDNALHIVNWSNGFATLCDDSKAAKATLKKVLPVDIPETSEIFCVPVNSSWGL